MENYLYFAESVVETGDGGFASPSEALCVPASSYIGADATTATNTEFRFKNSDGDDSNTAIVKIAHTSGKNKEVIKGVLQCINAHPSNGGFVVVADMETGTATTKSSNVNPLLQDFITDVAIVDDNVDGAIIGVSAGTTLWHSYGIGAISTDSIWANPRYYKYREQGIIITKILLDITGLACKGDAANDVIGLTGGSKPAYIMKYKSREIGVLFKAEVACLEVPGQGTATITTDIDLAFNASATLEYDGAAGTAEINTGGLTYVGDGFSGPLGAAPTENDYLYLVEGDTAATTGVYNAGKIMITLYGHEDFGA